MANRPGAAGTGGGGNRPIVNNPNVNRPINGGNNINSGNRTNNGGNTVINNNVTNVNNTSNRVNANNFNNSRNVNNFGNAGGGGYGYGNGGNNWPGRSNYAGYHSDWAHGSWNNHYPNYNTSNWGSFGVGFVSGAATWGLGSSLSNWGYSSYSNPYYYAQPVIVQQPTTVVVAQPAAPAAVVYDYTQPINVYSAPPEQSVAEQAVAQMDAGREAFKAGDYSTALNQTDHAIEKMPNDPSLHEFRALVLFAIGQYDAAASALYPVLSAGPGWDWTTMIGLYPNVDVYTQQLNDLKADIKNRPNTAQGHFLLAYHYLTQGYPDNARAELREVVRLQPGDTLSAKLLSQLSPPPANSAAPPNPTPAAPVAADEVANPPATPDAQGASLVGSWTASPNPDTKIILTLGDTGAFSWKVSQKSVTNELTGDSTFVNGILTLAPKEGSGDPLVGKVKTGDDGTFNFKAAGAPPDDPGLTFGKNPG